MPLSGKPAVVSSRVLQDRLGTLSLLDAGSVSEKGGLELYKLMCTREERCLYLANQQWCPAELFRISLVHFLC
jgi:hypothetical protein